MNKKYITISITVIVLAIAVGLIFFIQPKKPKTLEKLNVGGIAGMLTLITVAQQQGFFKDNGLDVNVTQYTSGVEAFDGLNNGSVDITGASEFSGVLDSFNNSDLKIVASIVNSTTAFQLIARKDHGINSPVDVVGKKVGLVLNTITEFYLDSLFKIHGISFDGTQKISVKDPNLLIKSIEDGSVDAIITSSPSVYDAGKKLGDNILESSILDNNSSYGVIYTKTPFIKSHPDTINRFIKSLVLAEKYILSHPKETHDLFTNQLHFSEDYIQGVVSKFNFVVSLSPEMLISMEDEARWVMEKKLVTASSVPNFLNYIYFDALDSVKPEGITIVR